MELTDSYRFSLIYTHEKTLAEKSLEISGDTIQRIGGRHSNSFDFGDRIAVPGFIDIHTHGIDGIDSYELNKQSLKEWSANLLERGTTGFVPTLVSAPEDRIRRFLNTVSGTMGEEPGAEILGARLEGPYISPGKKGAHDASILKTPSDGDYKLELLHRGNVLRILDIAPELKGAQEMIRDLYEAGIVPSIGHTNCDYETAQMGFNNGARLITHMYNAMRAFDHRDPGLIDFAFLENRIYAEIICDFVHVSPEAIRMAVVNKGPEKLILVSDSIHATGKPDGIYKLGTLSVKKQGERCTLAHTDTLAGSVLTLDKAVRNLNSIGIGLEEISKMASTNPSKVMKRRDLGSIRKGSRADITILDKALKVKGVIKRGKLVEF